MSACVLARVMSVSLAASARAGELIRDIQKSGTLDTVDKGVKDYQTRADRESQACIIGSLKHHFPKLTIVGEEGDMKQMTTTNNPVPLDSSSIPAFPTHLTELKEEDLVVWVDPLDATREFTEGGELLEHVTVLIGISSAGKPIGGVIFQPFLDRCIWAVEDVGVFGLKDRSPNNPSGVRRYATSRSHLSENVKLCLDAMQPCEMVKLGGSGYKVLCVAEKFVDAYVYPSLGTKKWDTCAPEAIMRAAGGFVTNIEGDCYDYSANAEHMNWMGVLAGFGSAKELAAKVPEACILSVKKKIPQSK